MENNQQEFQFKTNINCGGCISTVKPFLDQAEGVRQWRVDTASPNKVLTVLSEGISPQQIIETVQKAGFKIDTLHSGSSS
ncbi:MAG: heavy-metal-associated domain-containing protein [Bacteroidetes bacterium]|nr:heavy-metal-associated domain-containing protein [Bacteroidota bacterium]